MLEPGQAAPTFKLPSTGGGEVSLGDLRGKKVVLYFYPRDNTPGCTTEACDFRDNHAWLRRRGVEVLGVSKDSLSSHDGFRGKYALPFRLLSDPDNAVATRYGAYGDKMMYGRKVKGTIRSTFLIDERGKIERVWSPVRVKGHVDAVVAAVEGEAAPVKKAATKKPPNKKPAKKKVAQKQAAKKKAVKKNVAKKKAAKKKAAKKRVTKKRVAKKKAAKKKPAKKRATKKKATKKRAKKKRAK